MEFFRTHSKVEILRKLDDRLVLGHGARALGAYGPMYDLLMEYFPDHRTVQGVFAVHRFAGDLGVSHETIYKCIRSCTVRIRVALLILKFSHERHEPGCKYDCVAVIQGKQGGGKSSFWRYLAQDFFGELPKTFDKPDRMIEAMRGCLISEMGEMAGLRRETVTDAKEFITRGVDTHRLAYAHRVGKFPRQGVLTGTSNEDEILHDPTGNRRFWIWKDGHSEESRIDFDALQAAVPMLWGEAVDEYKAMRAKQPHGDLWLDLRSHEAIAGRNALAESVRAQTAVETIAETLQDWLETPAKASDVILDANGFPVNDNDERMVVRAMVTANIAFAELKNDTALSGFKNATSATYGKALKLIPGWAMDERRRLHGRREVWFRRAGWHVDGDEWSVSDGISNDETLDMLD